MIVYNSRGTFYYPYTLIKNKRVYYETKIHKSNGLRERQRRIRQTLKKSKLHKAMKEVRHERKINASVQANPL